jgi:hypothetical protein
MITENKMTQLFENFKKEIQDQDEKDIEVISDVLKDEINASEKIEALDWLINNAEKNKLWQIVMGDIYKSCLENMEGEELTEKDISEILEREEIINYKNNFNEEENETILKLSIEKSVKDVWMI